MTQITYNLYQAAAHIGLLYDIEPSTIVNACAEGQVFFGHAVVAGTDPLTQVKMPTATGSVFRGVALSTWAKEQNTSNAGLYNETEAVNILKQGAVWVRVNSNVAIDEAAYFVYTGANLGQFRNDNTDADAVPTGVFRSTANSGELALLEINLP